MRGVTINVPFPALPEGQRRARAVPEERVEEFAEALRARIEALFPECAVWVYPEYDIYRLLDVRCLRMPRPLLPGGSSAPSEEEREALRAARTKIEAVRDAMIEDYVLP